MYLSHIYTRATSNQCPKHACAETHTAKGILNAVYTMTKANKESNKFIYLNNINNGIAAATGGNILVLKIQSAKKLLPLNLKNVKPNAVGKEKTTL